MSYDPDLTAWVNPKNTGNSPNAASMLGQRLWRWPNIEAALGECPVSHRRLTQKPTHQHDFSHRIPVVDLIQDKGIPTLQPASQQTLFLKSWACSCENWVAQVFVWTHEWAYCFPRKSLIKVILVKTWELNFSSVKSHGAVGVGRRACSTLSQ